MLQSKLELQQRRCGSSGPLTAIPLSSPGRAEAGGSTAAGRSVVPAPGVAGQYGVRRPQSTRLSPQMDKCKRVFFEQSRLDSPLDSQVQALRLLVDWFREGEAAAADLTKPAATGTATATAADGGGGGGTVAAMRLAAEYRPDWETLQRALDVLRNLAGARPPYQALGRAAALASAASDGRSAEAQAAGLLHAARAPLPAGEALAAGELLMRVAVGCGERQALQNSNIGTLLMLYHDLALLSDRASAMAPQLVVSGNKQLRKDVEALAAACHGLSGRALAMKEFLLDKQGLPLSARHVGPLLSIVLADSSLEPAGQLATSIRFLEEARGADGAASRGRTGTPVTTLESELHGNRWLQDRLRQLCGMAVEQRNWAAYRQLCALGGAAGVAPGWEVVLQALAATADDGELAMVREAREQLERAAADAGRPLFAFLPLRQRQAAGAPVGPAALLLRSHHAGLRAAVKAGDVELAEKFYALMAHDPAFYPSPARKPAAAAGSAAAAAGGQGEGAGEDTRRAARLRSAAATLDLLQLHTERRSWARVVDLLSELSELEVLARRGSSAAATRLADAAPSDAQALLSPYGRMEGLARTLAASEQDAVAYYGQLIEHASRSAALLRGGMCAVVAHAALFGPLMRAAALRGRPEDAALMVKQLEAVGGALDTDTYTCLLEASLNAGKADRVEPLLELMEAESCPPNAHTWGVLLGHAASSRDGSLMAVAARSARAAYHSWVERRQQRERQQRQQEGEGQDGDGAAASAAEAGDKGEQASDRALQAAEVLERCPLPGVQVIEQALAAAEELQGQQQVVDVLRLLHRAGVKEKAEQQRRSAAEAEERRQQRWQRQQQRWRPGGQAGWGSSGRRDGGASSNGVDGQHRRTRQPRGEAQAQAHNGGQGQPQA